MQFAQSEQLNLPCTFTRIVPGELHPDGRRYLPLIVLALPPTILGTITQIGVVDRHHVVDLQAEGQSGSAKLVFLLSTIRLLGEQRSGLFDRSVPPGRPSTRPTAYGQVIAVPTWEADREHLPYETLYTELLIDIGGGIIGVRTSTTAANLAEQIGHSRIEPGDWIEIERSRVDILGFSI
ncbi:MAG: hypothetical protein SH847_25340 [Roseiflexaceae bacterium]|nr:hypothetical protein [Roseiflexaceae bacterium]